jgi:hypothetical protein
MGVDVVVMPISRIDTLDVASGGMVVGITDGTLRIDATTVDDMIALAVALFLPTEGRLEDRKEG